MLRTLSLSFCALLIFCGCNAGDPCPSKDKLSPCTCTQRPMLKDTTTLSIAATTPVPRKKRDIHENDATPEFSNGTSYYTVVKCESPKSLSDLEEKVSLALNRKWIDKLVVSNIPPDQGNTLASLPRDWLNYARIRQLEIKNTQLSGDFIWNKTPLKDQTESLYWLKVSNCYLSGALTYDTLGTVQTRGLNYLHRLQGIDLSSNHLTAVMVTAFKAPPLNLTTVILANNNIQHMDAGAFQHIPLLKHVDLSHNQLTMVLRAYFAAPSRYLKHVDMGWNTIRALPADFFVNMPVLKSVDLSYNFLFSLPASPWSVVWKQLSYINVSGNFIECDCGLLWILPILLPRNTNQTEPKPLPGQTVMGQCVQPLSTEPFETIVHDLISLKRDRLAC